MRHQAAADGEETHGARVSSPDLRDVSTWALMYRGALIALDVSQLNAAPQLAGLTRTDGEAWAAIAIMRRSPAGGKVQLALEWLRMRREVGVVEVGGGIPVDIRT